MVEAPQPPCRADGGTGADGLPSFCSVSHSSVCAVSDPSVCAVSDPSVCAVSDPSVCAVSHSSFCAVSDDCPRRRGAPAAAGSGHGAAIPGQEGAAALGRAALNLPAGAVVRPRVCTPR